MARFKTTDQIIKTNAITEYFDENWMNYDNIKDASPKTQPWDNKREIKFEDVDIWEIILESGGPLGVYAAWSPYAEYYIVVYRWSVIAEFVGYMANERLEKFLIENNIRYPKSKNSPTTKENKFLDKKLIITI